MEAWLHRARGYLALFLVCVMILAGILLWRQPTVTPIEIVEPSPRPTPTVAQITVYVSGAVQRPDVYVLQPNSRVNDAVRAAGGTLPNADLAALNLATVLHDGQQIHVPGQEEGIPTSSRSQPISGPLGLNTASAADLERLPGIGPVLAARIVEDREANGPYQSVEQLARVPGIGPALLGKLRPLLTVR